MTNLAIGWQLLQKYNIPSFDVKPVNEKRKKTLVINDIQTFVCTPHP
jgi:hypothetical protein